MNEWIETARAQSATARGLLAGITDTQLNARPDADTWSLGMQLDHLSVVLEKATAEMDKALEAGIPAGDPASWKPGFLERKFIELVGAQPGGKTNPVPKGFEPTEAPLQTEPTLTRFLAAQERLIGLMERTRQADIKKIKAASAAVPLIKFSLGTWFAAMEVHTQYHLDKAAALKTR